MRTLHSYSIQQVVEGTGVSRTSIYEEIRAGRLRAVKQGKRTLVLVDDLRRWLESLPPCGVPARPDQEFGSLPEQPGAAAWKPEGSPL